MSCKMSPIIVIIVVVVLFAAGSCLVSSFGEDDAPKVGIAFVRNSNPGEKCAILPYPGADLGGLSLRDHLEQNPSSWVIEKTYNCSELRLATGLK